jgi:hypothetical protein
VSGRDASRGPGRDALAHAVRLGRQALMDSGVQHLARAVLGHDRDDVHGLVRAVLPHGRMRSMRSGRSVTVSARRTLEGVRDVAGGGILGGREVRGSGLPGRSV